MNELEQLEFDIKEFANERAEELGFMVPGAVLSVNVHYKILKPEVKLNIFQVDEGYEELNDEDWLSMNVLNFGYQKIKNFIDTMHTLSKENPRHAVNQKYLKDELGIPIHLFEYDIINRELKRINSRIRLLKFDKRTDKRKNPEKVFFKFMKKSKS